MHRDCPQVGGGDGGGEEEEGGGGDGGWYFAVHFLLSERERRIFRKPPRLCCTRTTNPLRLSKNAALFRVGLNTNNREVTKNKARSTKKAAIRTWLHCTRATPFFRCAPLHPGNVKWGL
jgi:hypothetical protein